MCQNTDRFPLNEGQIYSRGGRTGKKIHRGSPDSTVLACGRWVKYGLHHYQVHAHQVERADASQFCEKCWATVVDGKPSTMRSEEKARRSHAVAEEIKAAREESSSRFVTFREVR